MLEIEESEEQGAYFYQIERIDKINAIDTETDVVKKKANDYKEIVLKNIDDSLDDIEEEIDNGDYENAQNDIEDIIKECKKSDSLGDQLDKCNELLKTCKEKKKEAEEQVRKQAEQTQQVDSDSNSNGSSKKVYCYANNHYVDIENAILDYAPAGNICIRQKIHGYKKINLPVKIKENKTRRFSI